MLVLPQLVVPRCKNDLFTTGGKACHLATLMLFTNLYYSLQHVPYTQKSISHSSSVQISEQMILHFLLIRYIMEST
ncbi:hypothetical protein PALA111701_31530 [Paenibacillus lactis]